MTWPSLRFRRTHFASDEAAHKANLQLTEDWAGKMQFSTFVPYTTVTRPDPTTVPPGSVYFDSTLRRPAWSDGTTWLDATGHPV